VYVKCDPIKKFTGPILPTEATIYYEDGVPFINYFGEVAINGHKAKIHFPKIGLAFDQVQAQVDQDYACDPKSGQRLIVLEYAQRWYSKDCRYFEYELLPQEVTLDELEKMLGYPVIIKEAK